ncbi:MAG: hypothetical protein GY835_03355 [bacterium]|nr:hypothetical protein [bacterium]
MRRAEVYVRPARGYAWPLVFLDDVATPRARAVTHKYEALIVETSPAGGCHIWLACARRLAESSRFKAQRWLGQRIAADLGSISGEHLGRLAGFKNWKRNGTWVNVLAATLHGRRWDPSIMPSFGSTEKAPPAPSRRRRRSTTDTTPSGKEWGWVCGLLEAGSPPELVYVRLLEKARTRRGADAPRYARRTLERALVRTGHADACRVWPREMPQPNPEEVRLPKA